jgi:hypothetical protein
MTTSLSRASADAHWGTGVSFLGSPESSTMAAEGGGLGRRAKEGMDCRRIAGSGAAAD